MVLAVDKKMELPKQNVLFAWKKQNFFWLGWNILKFTVNFMELLGMALSKNCRDLLNFKKRRTFQKKSTNENSSKWTLQKIIKKLDLKNPSNTLVFLKWLANDQFIQKNSLQHSLKILCKIPLTKIWITRRSSKSALNPLKIKLILSTLNILR